jgi:DNA-binding cell septation regulator SpoVG
MEISKIQVYPVAGSASLKGFAQVTLDNSLKITGLKIFDGPKGLYITYPRNPKSKKNLCFAFPTDKSLREHIEERVVTEFTKVND